MTTCLPIRPILDSSVPCTLINAHPDAQSPDQDETQLKIKQRAKQQVASQFSRAAHSYDQAAHIQQFSALELIKQLSQAQDSLLEKMTGHWLDLGCGTGFAVPSLITQGAQYITGADLAHGMSSTSHKKLTQLPFQAITADAEQLPFTHKSFDGIYSNLMVQWSEQIHQLFHEAHRVLKDNGLFAFATLGPRTMHELKSAWQRVDPYVHVNSFISKQELIQHCEKHFEIVSIEQQEAVQQHQSLTSLLKELKAIGATNVNPGRRQGLGGRARLQQLENAYPAASWNSDQLPLTYDLIWIVARKC